MKYYTIQNKGLLIADNKQALTKFYNNVLPLPRDYEPNKYIVVAGKLVLNPNWDNLQLQKAKDNKIQENDTARDNALLQGVVYQDVLFDSDTDQKVNLLAIVSTMGDEDTIVWFGMDNVPLECGKQDLINIGGLITQLHTFCWGHNAEIKQAINDALTVEEVNEIIIDYTLPEEEVIEGTNDTDVSA